MQTVRYLTPAVSGVSGTQTVRLADKDNSGTPLVQMVCSSDFLGSVVFKKDTAPPGGAQSLTSVICRERDTSDPITNHPAGTGFGSSINLTPLTDGLALFAVVTLVTGSVTLTTLQNWTGIPDESTVYLRNVTLTNIPVTYPEDLAFQFELAGTAAADVSTA